MSTDSTNGHSGNGNGHAQVTGELWADGKVVHDAPGSLIKVLLAECIAHGYREVLIELGDDWCPIHFVRAADRLERDSTPVRLFAVVKDRLARFCGGPAESQGTFSTSIATSKLSKATTQRVKVSVTFADASLQLTITEVKGATE